MEDAACCDGLDTPKVLEDWSFFAVFDGHGGKNWFLFHDFTKLFTTIVQYNILHDDFTLCYCFSLFVSQGQAVSKRLSTELASHFSQVITEKYSSDADGEAVKDIKPDEIKYALGEA